MPIDTDILALLDNGAAIRKRALIRQLVDSHQGSMEYTKKAIDGRISALVEDGRIVPVLNEDLAGFGLSDAGKNASYLISRQAFERKWRFDRMIEGISCGSRDDCAAALHEALLYKSLYRLTPAQLDMIVPALDHEYSVAYTALQCLYSAAVRRGDLPADTAVLTQKLQHLLERFRDDDTCRPAIRHAVHLLAYMGDEAVIGQLEHDAPRFDSDRLKREEYMYPVMVNVIDAYRSELHALASALMAGGKKRAARDIRAICEYALDPQEYKRKMQKIQEEEVEIF